ncbi:MAG TPA: sulfatase [Thermoanaerobaculia bacterium]|nr:sulfatase [Thermoanaerobaculia bacterium]
MRPLVAAAAGALLGAGLLFAACGGQGPALEYEDLVVSGRLAALHGAENGAEAGAERLCADETRFAVAVAGGRELDVPLVLGGAPELTVAACAPATSAPAAALVLRLQGRAGLASELRLPVDGAAWTERTLGLEAMANGPISLRIRVEAPADAAVLVSDLWVRHRPAEHDARAGGLSRSARGRARRPERAQILLVSVDTLRADAVTAPAGEPGLDPGLGSALAAFAARAESFDPHYAAASWTKPSHATLLTGLPVEAHGVELEGQALLPEATTLAERFSTAGLATAGLVYDCLWLDPRFGFDRGFDQYRATRWGGDQAAREAVSWIARHRREPFFYFLHLFTPHSDMEKLPYEGRGVSRATVAERFGIEDYGCRDGSCASSLLQAINRGLAPLPAEDRVLRFLYERGVATTDRSLGRLFSDLDDLGLLDRMLVVVTSDHGEAFLEHGKLLHSTLHEEILRVPLLIHWPGGERASERRTVPSSSIDLAPTLLAAAGLDREGLPGRDLRDLAAAPARRRALFAGTTEKAVIAWPWKAIFPVTHPGPPELYRLDRDPGERHDLAIQHPEVLGRLRDMGIGHVVASRELTLPEGHPDRPTLTPEERRRLEALGYLQ